MKSIRFIKPGPVLGFAVRDCHCVRGNGPGGRRTRQLTAGSRRMAPDPPSCSFTERGPTHRAGARSVTDFKRTVTTSGFRPTTYAGSATTPPTWPVISATISGPIVLVGHSYGGMVISNAATGNSQVRGLVFVDAYIPAEGDTIRHAHSPSVCVRSRPRDRVRLRPVFGSSGRRGGSLRQGVGVRRCPRERRVLPPGNPRDGGSPAAAVDPSLERGLRASGVGEHPLLGGRRRGRSGHPGCRPDRDGEGRRGSDR